METATKHCVACTREFKTRFRGREPLCGKCRGSKKKSNHGKSKATRRGGTGKAEGGGATARSATPAGIPVSTSETYAVVCAIDVVNVLQAAGGSLVGSALVDRLFAANPALRRPLSRREKGVALSEFFQRHADVITGDTTITLGGAGRGKGTAGRGWAAGSGVKASEPSMRVKLTTNDGRSVLLCNAKRIDATMFGPSWPPRRMCGIKASLSGIDYLDPFLPAILPDITFVTPSQMWRFFGASKPVFEPLQRLATAKLLHIRLSAAAVVDASDTDVVLKIIDNLPRSERRVSGAFETAAHDRMAATCRRSDTGWTTRISLIIGPKKSGHFVGNGGGRWSVALDPVSCVGTLTIRWSTPYPDWFMCNSAAQLTTFCSPDQNRPVQYTCKLESSDSSMPHWFGMPDGPVNCNWSSLLVESVSFQLMSYKAYVYEAWRLDGLWYICDRSLLPDAEATREDLVRLVQSSPTFALEHLALYCTGCGYAKENQYASQTFHNGLWAMGKAGAMAAGQPSFLCGRCARRHAPTRQ